LNRPITNVLFGALGKRGVAVRFAIHPVAAACPAT
jgi:NAD/NADP transhydrogenase beta subunit